MKLVKLENYELKVDDELLLYPAFKTLYKQDKTKGKSAFMSFLTILYFTYDIRSDYQYITNEKERLKEVCSSNGLAVPKFSNLQKECIAIYQKSNNTTASLLLEDTKVTIDKIREVLKTTDLSDLDEKDKVNAIKTVASTVAMIPKLVKDLSEAEKAVTKELAEAGRARGNQGSKTLMDDGILI